MAVLRAKEPFAYTDVTGVPRTVRTGDLFDSADPCVGKYPNLFETVEVAVARSVPAGTETASAAPGEVRSRRSTLRKSVKDDD